MWDDAGRRVRDLAKGARFYGDAVRARATQPLTRFVVLGTPRTGSELLVNLLDSHQQIHCESEILKQAPRWPLLALEGHAHRAQRLGSDAYGCKILADQIIFQPQMHRDGEFFRDLSSRGWKFVLIERNDLIAQSVSLMRAMNDRVFHVRESVATAGEEVDPVALIRVMGTLEERAEWLRDRVADLPHVGVDYERDLLPPDRHQATVDTISDFLSLDRRAVSTDLTRTSGRGWRDVVTNADVVERVLEPTRFAQYLIRR